MNDNFDIQNALRDYASPAPDNGFTAAVLERANRQHSLRWPSLAAAAGVGGLIMFSQMPSLWRVLDMFTLPEVSPLALTALGVLGFVGWAALDRGWSDAV